MTTTTDWKRYYGFSRTPFSKQLAVSQVFAHPGHLEAAARIRWLIDEQAIGLVTGEVGAGKTLAAVARPPNWTRPGTRSSTSPIPPSERVASTNRSPWR